MLATDANNPEFTGARNPDDGLFVEFYWEEPVDGWESNKQSIEKQRKVVVKGPRQPFVRIMVPGDKTTETCMPVSEALKQRFARRWMAWQISEGLIGGEEDIPGWKISDWDECSEDMARELLHMRFQTVEQLAGASDKQIQGIGMGGLGLREKARVALRNRMGAETKAALEAKEKETQELRDQMAMMQEQIAKLMAAQPEEKRGPGRPKAEATI